MTRYVRITSPPPGEAPAHIQAAWVGCLLPLFAMSDDRRVSGVRRGVLTRQRVPNCPGYAVRVLEAIAVLERHCPSAARWWRENTPYLMRPGKLLVFALESGRLCDASATAAAELVDIAILVPVLGHTPVNEPALPIGSGRSTFAATRPI